MKIFVLGTAPNISKKLVESIESKGHTYKYFIVSQLYLFVSQHENGHDRLYWGNPETNEVERIYIKDFDAVVSRIGANLEYGASILLHLTENLGIYSPQSADGLLTASNKMKTIQKLSSAGVRVPRTVMAHNPIHAEFLIKKIGGLPSVAKLLKGSQGVGVIILNDAKQTNMTLETFKKLDADVQLQEYIEGGGKDIRAVVIGGKVVVAMERTGNNDFRANLSKGGSGRKIDLTEDEKAMCIKMAKAVGLESAGVDILRGNDGFTYGIEVNGNWGEKIIGITGVNFFDHIIEHIEKNAKGGYKKQAEVEATAWTDDEIIESYLTTLLPSNRWFLEYHEDRKTLLKMALNHLNNGTV